MPDKTIKEHTIIGMAGHIDHGKTAVIRALTGIETDQLPEEKLRKITIDIGFAYWRDNVTVIDVPGHEKFIRNMVAGVHTVDLFMLIIAADDGIMPQTLEHLDILKFFNISDGIVVINKIDIMDDEWIEMVSDDVRKLLADYGFKDIPIIPVSATANKNIDFLKTAVQEKIRTHKRKNISQPFRLNVDRVFSSHGFGSVITGTILSDKIAVDDRVTVYPIDKSAKVRGIEVHQSSVNQADQGQRAAINLAGLEIGEIGRGSTLIAPESSNICTELMVQLRTSAHLAIAPKKYGDVRVHLGASELKGKINWLDDEPRWQAGREYHTLIKLSEPGVAVPGDPILIRSISPVHTIAGGKVLLTDPPKIKTTNIDWKLYYEILSADLLQEKINIWLQMEGFRAVLFTVIQKKFFCISEILSNELKLLIKKKTLVNHEMNNRQYYMLEKKLTDAVEWIRERLVKRSKKEKDETGFSMPELKQMFVPKQMDEVFLHFALKKAVNKGALFLSDQRYYTDDPAKNEAEGKYLISIADMYRNSRFSASALEEVAGELQIDLAVVRRLTGKLTQDGELISIDGKFYLHNSVFKELISFLKDYFQKEAQIDVGRLKSFTNVSRKYLIPLLEYLDRQGYTHREGNVRKKGSNLA